MALNKKPCVTCAKNLPIYSQGQCTNCMEKRLAHEKNENLSRDFKPAADYNARLFELFLRYVRRYPARYALTRQLEQMKSVLEEKPHPPITGWQDIYLHRAAFDKRFRRQKKAGSPYIKLGYMLEDIGAIRPRVESLERQMASPMAEIDPAICCYLPQFLDVLKKRRCKPETVVENLRSIRELSRWLVKNELEITKLNSKHYETLLFDLKENRPSASAHFLYAHHCRIKRFLRWLKTENHITTDPSENTRLKQPAKTLIVCSQTDLEKIRKFISSPKSDPELAFLLALILFYGFSYEEITNAQFGFNGDSLQIVVRKKQITYLKRRQREQIIQLPTTPAWFYTLTKRYYAHWLKKYERIKHSTLRQPLFIAHNAQYNFTIGRENLRKRVRNATVRATGHAIPAPVLKHTCGTLFVKGNDASILQKFGWSRNTAWSYTWVSRVVYTPKTSKNSVAP